MWLIVGYLFILSGSVRAKECDYETFGVCMRDVIGLEGGDFNIVNEEQLKEVCNSKMKTIECASDFIKNCMKPGEKDIYEATTGGKLKVVEEMCTEGTRINEGFVQNMECFQNLREEIHFCTEKFKESQTALDKSDMIERQKVFYGCCAFEWHRNCLAKVAGMKCDNKASDFMYYVSTVLGGQVQNQICSSSYSSCHGLHGVDQKEIDEKLKSISRTTPCACLNTQTVFLVVSMVFALMLEKTVFL